jgi:nuclear pore complex protein Nup93
MLAASAGGGGIELRGRLLRELLVESKDYGTLLGAGGALGSGGAIRAFVAGPEVRGRAGRGWRGAVGGGGATAGGRRPDGRS